MYLHTETESVRDRDRSCRCDTDTQFRHRYKLRSRSPSVAISNFVQKPNSSLLQWFEVIMRPKTHVRGMTGGDTSKVTRWWYISRSTPQMPTAWTRSSTWLGDRWVRASPEARLLQVCSRTD